MKKKTENLRTGDINELELLLINNIKTDDELISNFISFAESIQSDENIQSDESYAKCETENMKLMKRLAIVIENVLYFNFFKHNVKTRVFKKIIRISFVDDSVHAVLKFEKQSHLLQIQIKYIKIIYRFEDLISNNKQEEGS